MHRAIRKRGGRKVEFTKRDTNFIKGVAICFMLYHHLFAFPERVLDGEVISLISLNGTALSLLLGAFGCICMPMFTFLSGYGLYRSSLRGEAPAALVGRHLLNLYKTYWKVFFVCLPVVIVKAARAHTLSGSELIYNFLGLRFSVNAEWWFVLPFAVLLILFPGMKRFVERKHASFYSDVLLLLSINAVFLYVIPSVMEFPVFASLGESAFYARAKELMELFPAYVAGVIFARYDLLSRVKTRFGARSIWCAAALCGMAAVFLIRPHNNKTYGFVNAAVFIVCMTVLLPSKPFELVRGVFEELGRESAMMWLTHSFFCYYWLQGLVYAPKYPPLIFLWLLALSYGAAKLIKLIYKYLGKAFARLRRA